ncbi:sn-glycerol-1-phosphate dehydrogenase [Paenibacillus sp. TRM 82003]|nr:sn-glycerol-1-phosphate dehydrogenase [Paenibacillus sp. TRM 82003]
MTEDILHDMLERLSMEAQSVPARIDLERIRIGGGVLSELAPYAEEKGFRNVVIVTDAATYRAAGERAAVALRRAGVTVHETMLQPDGQGDVLADEATLVQLIVDIQRTGAKAAVAVGGGTIHDVVRYCAYTLRIPFLSVPTAPSVDGFTSRGAPILLRGEKKTIPAIGPNAIFADMEVLQEAPQPLIAAGFSDLLGKYTSLFDWRFGASVADEPYSEAAAVMTRRALARCVEQADRIARREPEGLHALMLGLIESGVAMLAFGQSHPASGAEHHLSHYWEMEYLKQGKRQLLHGAKVGVACIEIRKLYANIAHNGFDSRSMRARDGERQDRLLRIRRTWDETAASIEAIPTAQELAEKLRMVGAPVAPSELDLDPQLLERSLREAHHVRPERFTLLRAWNEYQNDPSV